MELLPIFRSICILIFCLCGIQTVLASGDMQDIEMNSGGGRIDLDAPSVSTNLLSNVPLFFVPNEGQMDPAVLFTCKGKDYTLFFTKDRVVYSLPLDGEYSRTILFQRFSGGNTNPVVEGIGPLETRVSYFTGPQSDWHTDITPFGALVYWDIYPGIDVIYRGEKGAIKREFIVNPGADPYCIRMTYEGAAQVRMAGDGGLAVMAGSGEIRESAPICYQEVEGMRVEIPCRFDVREDGSVSFYIGAYDRSQLLMIDPVLVYCGYIGGWADDFGYSNAVDADGNTYVSGYTGSDSTYFPDTVGPDTTFNGGFDAFVAKVYAGGTGLVYCGYIGGSANEFAYGIAIDGDRNAYVAGYTGSTQDNFFPVTGTLDPTFNGGGTDGFVAKVNPAGTGLVYCGYIGGSGDDFIYSIAVDGNRNAYVTGYTDSTETTMGFPVLVGPDVSFNLGSHDAFVAEVNAAGNALVYCGYIGGSGDDIGNDIAVDTSGNAYVTGYTSSSDTMSFPVTGTLDSVFNGGDFDAFVAKVNAAGNGLTYCGYIGGSSGDYGNAIAVDTSGNAFVTGYTSSTETTFPETAGSFDVSYNGGWDAFVARVNTAGTALDYCGYYGGAYGEQGNGIAVDTAGNAVITGRTDSTANENFPLIKGPDLTYNGGYYDAFVAKVNPGGTALVYSGYIGGEENDIGNDIKVDVSGNAYITGHTISYQDTFPVLRGPDLTHNSGYDAFVTKVSDFSSSIGVFRPSTHTFYLDYNGNGVWNGAGIDRAYNFGLTGDQPVSGDWNALGRSCIGVFRNTTRTFYLDWDGNGVWNGIGVDRAYNFGLAGDIPLSGDWNALGRTCIGVFRPSTHTFYLDWNGNGVWDGAMTDRAYNFGLAGDIPVSGDWNALGRTCIGVFRPSTHTFYLDWNGNGVWDGAVTDRAYNFGLTADLPVSGDWGGFGTTGIGVFRPSTHMFYLDYNGNGVWNGALTDCTYNFGLTGDRPVHGVWG